MRMRNLFFGAIFLLLLPFVSGAATVDPATGMADLGSFAVPAAHADGTALGPGVITLDGKLLYVASATSGKIWKLRVRDDAGNSGLDLLDSISVSGASNFSVALMDPAGRYAYFATDTRPAHLIRIQLSDFTVSSLTFEEGNDFIHSGIIDKEGTHLYLGTGTSPGKILKVSTSSLILVGTLPLAAGELDVRAAVYNPIHNHAYFATNTSPGTVVQVNLGNFSIVTRVTFTQNVGPAHAAVFSEIPSPMAYFGIYGAPGKIVRFAPAPFAEVVGGALALPDPEFLIRSAGIDATSGSMYFLTDTSPVRLIKVSAATDSRVGRLDLPRTNGSKPYVIMDSRGEYLYTSTAPNALRRIALTPAAATRAEAPRPLPVQEPPIIIEPPLFPDDFLTGDRVKLPDDGNPATFADTSIYYLARNGKRYVFPNDKVYFSWYASFATVKTVTTSTLAAIPFGGVVTYRPGVRMVKLQSSPTVYAVLRGGLLREVASEAVAAAFYGSTWNQYIDDLSDAFWPRYRLGDPIVSAGDFVPSAETAAVGSIDYDKGL